MKSKNNISTMKRMSVYLACTLAASTPVITLANTMNGENTGLNNLVKLKEQRGSYTTSSMIEASEVKAKNDYFYDFSSEAEEILIPLSYTAANPIDTLYSPDGIIKINGNHTMYHHGSDYGLVVKEDNSFEVKVEGNATVIFEIYGESNEGGINAAVLSEDSQYEGMMLTGTIREEGVAFEYTGEAATLTFTMVGGGEYYLRSIAVRNNVSEVMGEMTVGNEAYSTYSYTSEKMVKPKAAVNDLSPFSAEGYAQNATGGGILAETDSNYYKVGTAEEFLKALAAIKKNKMPSVIEVTQDIGLGNLEIGSAVSTYSSIIKAANNQALLHPTLKKTGVSTLYIKEMSNLTIYSKNGAALKHACFDINKASNIIIRNIVFDELWEWDEGGTTSSGEVCVAGDYDRNDWDYMTIQNESTDIWVDHCTFYKAYDGIVDVKKAASSAPTNVTISWCEFLPESKSSFFDEMMELLESDPSAYPYYNKLMTSYGLTKDQIRGYAAAQKKTHLIGASDKEANIQNLQLTLANNHYKDSMDRMPRLRGGNSHVYNCILDASKTYAVKNSITDKTAYSKIVSNGAISTCGASLLMENTYINGIMRPLASGNGSSPGGYINAANSVYYLDNQLKAITVTDNAGQGMILDADDFVSKLPYQNYKLYDANDLDTKVLPYAGAGVLEMTKAEWQATMYEAPEPVKTYIVTFNYDGATSDNGMEQMKVTAGETYENLPEPKKDGYTFKGWYTQSSGGEKVEAATLVTSTADHTLYARWEKQPEPVKTYIVTFNYEGATSNHDITQMKVTAGKTYENLPEPKKDGYIFKGWYTQSSGGEKVEAATLVTSTADHTLYARWEKQPEPVKTYIVTFNYDGATSNNDITQMKVTAGKTYENLPEPKKDGYTFKGWYTQSSGGEKVEAATLVTSTADHTLYARWEKQPEPVKTYIVTFNYDGATSNHDITQMKVTAGKTYENLPEPKKDGYTFKGWYTQSSGGEKVEAATLVTSTADHTLYARWEKQPEVTPPVGGDNGVTPPADGDNGVTPPVDGDNGATPPADGDSGATPPADGDSGVTPPADGDSGVIPPADGDSGVIPPADGDSGVTPPADGDNGATPPADGDSGVTPPAEDSGDTNTGGSNTGTSGGGGGSSRPSKAEEHIAIDESIQSNEEKGQIVEVKFTDISTHWAEEAIQYVASKGIFKGIDEAHFEPDTVMTRAMFISVLHRLAGEPEAFGNSPFTDVPNDAWYETAVAWANQCGITVGVSSNVFNPDEGIVREEMITMLYRYICSMKINLEQTEEAVSFADEAHIGFWAKNSMSFMAQTGIILGDEKNNCKPKEAATRAHASVMLHRLMTMLEAK